MKVDVQTNRQKYDDSRNQRRSSNSLGLGTKTSTQRQEGLERGFSVESPMGFTKDNPPRINKIDANEMIEMNPQLKMLKDGTSVLRKTFNSPIDRRNESSTLAGNSHHFMSGFGSKLSERPGRTSKDISLYQF